MKAQVLAGGRGLGVFTNGFKGGVHLVDSAEKAGEIAEKMLGSKLVTKQTGAEGKPVNTVFKLLLLTTFHLTLYISLQLFSHTLFPPFYSVY